MSVVLRGQEFCREQSTSEHSGASPGWAALCGVWSGLGSLVLPVGAQGPAQTGTGLHSRFAGRWQSPVGGPPHVPAPGGHGLRSSQLPAVLRQLM